MKSFTLKFALLFLLGVGLASTAAAQKIGGVVKDSAGKPVIGASVVVDGTTLGASSGVDGRWTLTVPDASKKTLVISYIGMKTQRIAIGSKTQIDVRLEDESTAMDDVVVVGYATVKRRDVVGSVASVNAETLQQMPVASVAEAMTAAWPACRSRPRRETPTPKSVSACAVRGRFRRTAHRSISSTDFPWRASATSPRQGDPDRSTF